MSICKDCFHSYVCEQFNENRECDNQKCHFANDHFIPIEDAVKVVRCKDCRYWQDKNSKGTQGICNCGEMEMNYGGEFYPLANDFCSYGELKEREG